MTTPSLPETAPFNPAQRSWLNGFFAGLVSTSAPAATLNPEASSLNPQVEEEFPWHDPALSMADRMELAKDKPIERRMMAAMAQLDCGACGYICQSYSEAIANGEEKNLTLCSPGGKETSAKLKELVQLGIKPSAAKSAPAVPGTGHAPSTYSRKNPYPGRLIAAKPLNRPGSDKDTRHVIFDLKSSGLSYKPGDALGVWPENCPDLINEILDRLHATGAEDVPTPDGQHTSLYEALLRDYTITHPTEDIFQLLGMTPTENISLLDALREYEGPGLDLAKFVTALTPLQPRLYSISSSLLAHPDQVHLTVGVVRYKSGRGTTCKGTASTYLAERLRPGQKARIFFHASKFGLPEDTNAPVIMVGPGTGIAPFRAFLAHRKAQGASGKNWLFFGDQRQATDFLYEDELNGYVNDGTLTTLTTAFSRDQKHKVYVQTRMLEEGREIFAWLEAGGHFYVCGDAKRMAKDVDDALKQIISTHGKMNMEDAREYLAKLAKESRYQRDVY